jgi:hypothetical protein
MQRQIHLPHACHKTLHFANTLKPLHHVLFSVPNLHGTQGNDKPDLVGRHIIINSFLFHT